MAKSVSKVLGIDIGSQTIKVAEVQTQGREPIVTGLGMIETPEGAVDHTGVFNSDAVGGALKQVITQSGATVSDVVVSIAGQASVLVRTLGVPRMNPEELTEHMQWEISRNIPFAESTVVSDYKPLADEDPNSPNMDVVMAIAPQSAVDTILACVRKAGKHVAAIDVQPLGLARSLQQSYDDETHDQTVCVVDMGHKTTSINIYRNGKLLLPRQVPLGGEMFTTSIADALKVSSDDAERMKRESHIPDAAIAGAAAANPFSGQTAAFQPYNPFGGDASAPQDPNAPPIPAAEPPSGPPSEPTVSYGAAPTGLESTPPPASSAPVPQGQPEATTVYNAYAPVLEEFTAEIRRSIDHFKSRGGDVARVLVCGGGAHLRGLPEYLSKSLGLGCDAYDPTRRLNLNMRKVAPGFVEEHRPEFAVAIGNGLHIFFE